jgi:hypothetical protein
VNRLAAGEANRSRSAAKWTMLTVGLLATVAVTVYLTRLARKALRQRLKEYKPEA